MTQKTGGKTGDGSPPTGTPATHGNGGQLRKGYDPRRGHGVKGRSGRKPGSFREACQEALQQARGPEVLGKIVSGDILELLGKGDDGSPIIGVTKNADRVQAFKALTSYAHGLPVQPTVDLTPRPPAALTTQQLIEAIPRLAAILPGDAKAKVRLLAALDTDSDVVD